MSKSRVILVMPGFNVAQVLPKTIAELPRDSYDAIIFVDDGSKDNSAQVARQLGLTVIVHPQNRGYGGAQKTGFKAALDKGADVMVLVHADNQYDPSRVPIFIQKIVQEGCGLVTGTRMILGDALSNGMPIWKLIPNRLLTWLENFIFNTRLTDYHNGFRAYSAEFLAQVPLDLLSEKFDFDTDIIIQASIRKVRMAEVPHQTRYAKENSQMPFSKGVVYGLSILRTVFFFVLHKAGIYRQQIYTLSPQGSYART